MNICISFYYTLEMHIFMTVPICHVGIARVLTLNPKLLIADEPVSALDVSIQAQIINLLVRLQDELQLSYLFVSHDLAVVEHIADRVAIMYLGKIVEIAPSQSIYNDPRHPYTQALLTAIPIPDPKSALQRTPLQGDIPNPANPPSGCPFRTRWPLAQTICSEDARYEGSGRGTLCSLPLCLACDDSWFSV